MGSIRVGNVRPAAEVALTGAILDVLDCPALLVRDAVRIIAVNDHWRRVFSEGDDSSALPSVSEWLGRLENGEVLLEILQKRGAANEPVVVGLPGEGSEESARRFDVRITHGLAADAASVVTVITLTELKDRHPDHEVPRSIAHMDRLLVRQTLIEERERRRLGRAVHDDVTQLLVQVRRRLADAGDGEGAFRPQETIADIDRVIRVLQDLTSTFSPPVLEDLGLLPAMHWLAEHLHVSYGAMARCEDDGVEPRLSAEVRTIAFRALRELTINATKHAPGAPIVLSSRIEGDRCRLTVLDEGPGFERGKIPASADSNVGYGLLSVEQQIRAVGGVFEVRSVLGEGTSAAITLPLNSEVVHADSDEDA